MNDWRVLHGDCLEVLATMPDASVDACVTDPPYDLTSGKRGGTGDASMNLDSPAGRSRIGTGGGFMGLQWDGTGIAFDVALWQAIRRVLKPGGYVLACGGTRTYHRMAAAIEDAGFEIRDCLAWLYGSGFPKSLNLGDGLGTALKPAYEPIVLARAPFKGTVAANVARFGTGALNIDACRIETGDDLNGGAYYGNDRARSDERALEGDRLRNGLGDHVPPVGRWPANVCLDEIAAAVLDEQSGELVSGDYSGERSSDKTRHAYGAFAGTGPRIEGGHKGDVGGASRFYYVAKPSREERDYGCDSLPVKSPMELTGRKEGSAGLKHGRAGTDRAASNFHPTVKPVELMRWLVRLVTPPNGTVLDPFTGSGTTGMACRYEQRGFIGIEREADYLAIANARIGAVAPLFNLVDEGKAVDAVDPVERVSAIGLPLDAHAR